ncbi:MAG: hypothetical protein WDA71_01510 [Actinomycetota bacterium]
MRSADVIRVGVSHVVGAFATGGDDGQAGVADAATQRLLRWTQDTGRIQAKAHLASGWSEKARAGIAVAGPMEADGQLAAPSIVVWGLPLGSSGEASDDEIREAVRARRADELDGVFALFALDAESMCVLTSTWPVGIVREVSNGPLRAWATRGGAAHALANSKTQIAGERVAELVTLDHVIGADELLAGTALLEEGCAVEVTRNGVRRSSPSRSALYEPAPRADARLLREVVGDSAERLVGIRGARLGLTGGRDTRLIVSCLAERGVMPKTFTVGHPEFPDMRGARALAAKFGWQHDAVEPAAYDGTPLGTLAAQNQWIHQASQAKQAGAALFGVLTRAALWTDGLGHPRAALVGHPQFPWDDTVWVTGHGAEIGRAYYWHGHRPPLDPVPVLTDRWRSILSPSAWATLRERVAAEIAETPGNEPATRLDVFYARNWIRKYIGPALPADRRLAAYSAIYLCRPAISTLLALPQEDRATSRAFGAAISIWSPDLHRSRAAVVARSMLARARQRLRIPAPSPLASAWPLLEALLRHLDQTGYRYRGVFDDAWWSRARRDGERNPRLRPPLWWLVAAEAAAAAVELSD